jgi:hypothetical protein
MNFSRAVKGHLTRAGAIRAIQSQAETELGRKLSKEEESLLFTNTHPNIFQAQIEKVLTKCFIEFCSNPLYCLVWIWLPQIQVVLEPEPWNVV